MARGHSWAAGLVAVGLVVVPAPRAEAVVARGVTLATPGTPGPVTFDAVTGSAVFFSTAQGPAAGDTDGKLDVYRFAGDGLTLMTAEIGVDTQFDAVVPGDDRVLVSAREGGVGPELALWRHSATGGGKYNTSTGNNSDAFFKAVSADGTRVVFESAEDGIDFDDDAGAIDVITAVFDPGGGVGQTPLSNNTLEDARFVGGSADLTSIVYETDEAVDPEKDENLVNDLYGAGGVWGGPGFPPLLSDGVGGPDTFGAVAANGATIVYTTSDDNTAAGDGDGQPDVYRSMGLGGELVSSGSSAATYAGSTPGSSWSCTRQPQHWSPRTSTWKRTSTPATRRAYRPSSAPTTRHPDRLTSVPSARSARSSTRPMPACSGSTTSWVRASGCPATASDR